VLLASAVQPRVQRSGSRRAAFQRLPRYGSVESEEAAAQPHEAGETHAERSFLQQAGAPYRDFSEVCRQRTVSPCQLLAARACVSAESSRLCLSSVRFSRYELCANRFEGSVLGDRLIDAPCRAQCLI